MVVPMPLQRARANAEMRSFGNNVSSIYLVFFLTQQGRQRTLNAVRTVLKQNANAEGRWVLRAARRGWEQEGDSTVLGGATWLICSSALGFPPLH